MRNWLFVLLLGLSLIPTIQGIAEEAGNYGEIQFYEESSTSESSTVESSASTSEMSSSSETSATTSESSSSSSVSSDTTTQQTTSSTQVSKTGDSNYPSTGEQVKKGLSIAGIILLLVVIGVFLWRRKKMNEEK